MAAEIQPESERACELVRMLPLGTPVVVLACDHQWHVLRATDIHIAVAPVQDGVPARKAKHRLMLVASEHGFRIWVPWPTEFEWMIPCTTITKTVETALCEVDTKHNATNAELLLRVCAYDSVLETTARLKSKMIKEAVFLNMYGGRQAALLQDYAMMEAAILDRSMPHTVAAYAR